MRRHIPLGYRVCETFFHGKRSKSNAYHGSGMSQNGRGESDLGRCSLQSSRRLHSSLLNEATMTAGSERQQVNATSSLEIKEKVPFTTKPLVHRLQVETCLFVQLRSSCGIHPPLLLMSQRRKRLSHKTAAV